MSMIIAPADMQFLLEMRDYLNSAASPASGGTIAFSTLVSDRAVRQSGDPAGAFPAYANAVLAFPEYQHLARRLRGSIGRIVIYVALATFAVTSLAAYVYWGNSVVSGAMAINAQLLTLKADIQREEAAGTSRVQASARGARTAPTRFVSTDPSGSVPGAPAFGDPGDGTGAAPDRSGSLVFLCDATETIVLSSGPVELYRSASQEFICHRYHELQSDLSGMNAEVQRWGKHLRRLFGKGAQQIQTAAFDISVMNGYVIPLLMGFLGSAAYVLRQFLKRLGDRVLTTRDVQSNRVRLVLGTLSGLAIGFFLNPAQNPSPAGTALGMGISLTAPALAFLAGYAVEVVFKFLDTIAGQAFVMKP